MQRLADVLRQRHVDAEVAGQRGLDNLLLHLPVERHGHLVTGLPDVDQRVLLGERPEEPRDRPPTDFSWRPIIENMGRQDAADRLRGRIGAAIFERVAGPKGPDRRRQIHQVAGERWFAADRPVRQVHGDSSMFIGGIRALLLQSLHPLAMSAT